MKPSLEKYNLPQLQSQCLAKCLALNGLSMNINGAMNKWPLSLCKNLFLLCPTITKPSILASFPLVFLISNLSFTPFSEDPFSKTSAFLMFHFQKPSTVLIAHSKMKVLSQLLGLCISCECSASVPVHRCVLSHLQTKGSLVWHMHVCLPFTWEASFVESGTWVID